MDSGPTSRPAQPMKFSRYRSVRKAAATQQRHTAFSSPPPPMPQQIPRDIPALQSSSTTRSREKSADTDSGPQSPRAQWQSQSVSPPVDDRFTSTPPRSRTVSSSQAYTRLTSDHRDRGSGHRRGMSSSAKEIKEDEPQPEIQKAGRASNGIVQEKMLQTREDRTEDDAKREREGREDFLKRQKRRELERLEKELSKATPVASSPPPSHPKNALSAAFSRRRKRPVTPPPSSESNHKTSSHQRETAGVNGIKPGGRGVVPGIDAPRSAVNSGERVSLFSYRVISIAHTSFRESR